MSVLLIAGHGEGDPGVIGQGYKEEDLTREMVSLIGNKLYGEMPYYVYNTNLNCYRQCRNNYVPEWTQFEYVLEIHFNAYNESVSGTEILVHPSREGLEMERMMLSKMRSIGFANRGIKIRNNLLIMNLCKRAGVKYALFEICFIDSRTDIAIYQQRKNDIALMIAHYLKAYYGVSGGKASLYKVQVGAFSKRKNAERMEMNLLAKGYDTYIVQENSFYKVQVGAFSKKANAIALKEQLENDGYETYLRGGL